jgi:protein involved in polysaccharide export with SLBB domain
MIRRTISVLALLCSLAAAGSSDESQGSSMDGGDARAAILASPELLKKSSSKIDFPTFSVPDSLFRLSAGDQLRLRWWGVGTGDLDLVVDTRGDLVIPDMGRIPTRNRNFRSVRDSVEALLKRRIKTNLIDLQIVKVGKANVRVSGLIPKPGLYSCVAAIHVSEVLRLAGLDPVRAVDSLTSDLPGLYYAKDLNPSLRKVMVVRANDTTWVDLMRSLRTGDPSQDPVLFDGDAIRIVPRELLVTVAGGAYSGYVELLKGESISSILAATGEMDTLGPVELMDRQGHRRMANPKEVLADSNVALVHILSRKAPTLPPIVWVVGQVNNPGAYPFSQGMKAGEALKMAGGIVGSEDSGVVVAVKKGWSWIPAVREPSLQESFQIPELKVAMVDYWFHMKGNYSDPNADLQSGDTVYVYKADHVVWVAGKVTRPGFVPWKKGASLDYYIDQAGGYAPRAWVSRTQLFSSFTSQSIALNQPIIPGAAIVVPEERFISPDQWFSIAATTVSLAIALVGLMIQVSK